MVFMGIMLQAALISEVDDYCLDSPGGSSKLGLLPIFYSCHGGSNQAFKLNEVDGKLCRKPGVCLASKNNSDQDKAEVEQTAVVTQKGGIWKFKDGNLINGFGLCLERDLEDSPSQLIQSKCDPESNWQKFRFK